MALPMEHHRSTKSTRCTRRSGAHRRRGTSSRAGAEGRCAVVRSADGPRHHIMETSMHRTIRRSLATTIVAAVAVASVARVAVAQVTPLPTPESVFGFPVGAERKLFTYDESIAYFRRLGAASPS